MHTPPPHPEWIAHRGAPHELPENTLAGFLRALERGAEAVELDVHRTRDGAVVVHHDPEIATADGRRAPITALTAAEVAAAPSTGGHAIPTLAQVLDAIGPRAMVYIELKGEGVGPDAARIARAHGHRYALHSFDHALIRALRPALPDVRLGMLIDQGVRDPMPVVHAPEAQDVWPHWSLVNAALVNAAHAAGKRVLAWTVNDADAARRLAALGVDGICTDDVRLLAH